MSVQTILNCCTFNCPVSSCRVPLPEAYALQNCAVCCRRSRFWITAFRLLLPVYTCWSQEWQEMTWKQQKPSDACSRLCQRRGCNEERKQQFSAASRLGSIANAELFFFFWQSFLMKKHERHLLRRPGTKFEIKHKKTDSTVQYSWVSLKIYQRISLFTTSVTKVSGIIRNHSWLHIKTQNRRR